MASPGPQLDKLLRIARARREIFSTRPALLPVGAAAEAGDRENLTDGRVCRGDRNGRRRGLPDHKRRQVPGLVPANHSAGRLKAVGKLHEHRRATVSHNVPVGEHQTLVAIDVDKHPRAERRARLLRGHDPGDGGVRRLAGEQVIGKVLRRPDRGSLTGLVPAPGNTLGKGGCCRGDDQAGYGDPACPAATLLIA